MAYIKKTSPLKRGVKKGTRRTPETVFFAARKIRTGFLFRKKQQRYHFDCNTDEGANNDGGWILSSPGNTKNL